MYCPKCGIENPDNGKFCRTCGSNLSGVLAVAEGAVGIQSTSQDPRYADLYGKGLRNVILGMGFILASIFMKTMPGDTFFWLFLLIPGISLLASGIPNIVRAEAIKGQPAHGIVNDKVLKESEVSKALPASKTEYVGPQTNLKTNDLVASSVTEETTRNLN